MRDKLTHGVQLQHYYAMPHINSKAMDAIHHLGSECPPHLPYSPDLGPRDYWLFGEIKRPLRGKRFDAFSTARQESETSIIGPSKEFYSTGIENLPGRWI
ncbi:Histone-lysine N-methyltransferase SETMAR-like [Oopsacas minuta]|uniref:Histone-lysine N-methyltransferase SETMAR-like n=1 Tax=Oopsacas minuta TaxID=111878 RepID=A0AAV7JIG9_9METZ|nr:Histone-lysine N-methyltransferase SETMAR-like [Oopsacas minuta]